MCDICLYVPPHKEPQVLSGVANQTFTWLAMLRAVLLGRTTPVVCMDANGHFGAQCLVGAIQAILSLAVGSCGMVIDNANGQRLREVLEQYNCAAVNTVMECRKTCFFGWGRCFYKGGLHMRSTSSAPQWRSGEHLSLRQYG